MGKGQQKMFGYAHNIIGAIQDVLNNEDNEFHIPFSELDDDDNITMFIHALANMMPTNVFNALTGSEKDTLDFNHTANKLCFQFSNLIPNVDESDS